MSQATSQARLCPHCANSVPVNALRCPYCKAEMGAPPQWPGREDDHPIATAVAQKRGISATSIALVILLLGGLGLGTYYFIERRQTDGQLRAQLEIKQNELQERDAKIENLEKQLIQVRQETQRALSDLKKAQSSIEDNRNKLAEAKREIDRLSAARAVTVSRATERSVEPPPPAVAAPAAPATPERRAERSRIYETTRPTTVFEGPATSSRIVSRIETGTEVTVVRTIGTWFEIRSKHGNPSGFIRADDVKVVNQANLTAPGQTAVFDKPSNVR